MQCYSAIEKNEFSHLLENPCNGKIIILSEIRQTLKANITCILSYIDPRFYAHKKNKIYRERNDNV